MKKLSEMAYKIEGQPMFKLLAKVNEMETSGEKIIHFEIGDSYFDTPPSITQSAIQSLNEGETHYVNSMGISELREAVCEATERDYGYSIKREQVVITPGANSIIYYLIRCGVNPGDEVIIPDPSFPTYLSAINCIGVKPVIVPLAEQNEFRINPADIEKKITDKTRLIIINSPNNPTGSVLTEDEINEIGKIAEKHDLYILSDEIYAKMIYDKNHYSVTNNDHCKKRTIMLNGFSKPYAMSGWRLGYAIGPENVVERIGLLIQTINSCVPPFVQRAGIKALLDGDESVASMMKEYKKRRDLIVKGLNSIPGISCQPPQGAIYVFPDISNTGLTDVEFADFMLKEAGVALLPGTNFGKYGQGHVRLCYATSIENIEEGITRMRDTISEKLNEIKIKV